MQRCHRASGRYSAALVFACRRLPSGWIDAELKKWIDVHPTHWREWVEKL